MYSQRDCRCGAELMALYSLSEVVWRRLILFSERLQYPTKREPQVNYYLMEPVN